MPQPKMIVSDLDGTLLRPDESVSTRTLAVLERAKVAGVPVVIATGRPAWWLPTFGFDGYAACMNGAMVIDLGRWQVLSADAMSVTILAELVTKMSAAAPGCSFAVERTGLTPDGALAEFDFQTIWDDDFRRVTRAELISEPAMKLFVRWGDSSEELAARLAACAVPAAIVTYSSDCGLVEVCRAGVNKAVAVAKLAAKWDIDPAEVICFGDMINDLEMLTWAGRGVAMANAHQRVLAIADEVTASNDQDGVAQTLERWF